VHNLIERCIQLYMTRKEIVTTLQNQAKIGPEFTEPSNVFFFLSVVVSNSIEI
jgi:uncharacterized protein (TIGR01589 family)